jgi:hypothetical protein
LAEPAAGRLDPLYADRAGRYWSDLVARFERAAEAGTNERSLVMGGVPVRMHFAGEAMEPMVAPAFGHLPRHDGHEPSREVLIWDTASTGVEPPEPVWGRAEIGPLEEILLGEGPVSVMSSSNHGGLLAYDSRSGTLVYHLPDAARVPWYERAAPMRAGLHWLLSGPKRHLLHAAAVGEGGRGALIAAPGGSGKSTLAVACFEAGLGYAGDDYVVADIEGPPLARSLFATAKVDAAALALIDPKLAVAHDPDFAEDEKAVLDLRAGSMVPELPVSVLLVPQLSDSAGPRLEPIGGAEALRYLGPSSILQLPRPRGAAWATAAELARSSPTWRLHLTEDMDAAVELVREALSGRVSA